MDSRTDDYANERNEFVTPSARILSFLVFILGWIGMLMFCTTQGRPGQFFATLAYGFGY